MNEFVNHLHEVFEDFGPIRSRRMFGGYGIYHEDRMIALVADNELFLKADDKSAHWFEELDLPPFQYNKKGKMITMSFFAAPEEIFDDRESACLWAEHAYQAAVRSGKPSSASKRKKKKS